MPNLSTLAAQHINFSSTQTFGGIQQVAGTGWTIAGLTSYMCAVPLRLPIGGNSFSREYFLDSATCLGDILHSLNYTQQALQGSDREFSGMRQFFGSHFIALKGSEYFDAQYLKTHNIDPQTKNGFWGIKDVLVLNEGKLFLQEWQKKHYNAKAPQENAHFALYLTTIDTHHPEGFIDKQNCKVFDDKSPYENSILCADLLISEFIEWVQQQDFYKDTTIVVLGDHLSMKQNFFPKDTKRAVFNTFINPSFSTNLQPELLKNRQMSHFDMSVLILDSIGLEVEAFGLGRNPLKGKTLLEELGREEFNKLLNQSSRFYNSLWKPNPTKHIQKETK
ncbi:sulfatase-like hydrolase/transferase [Helicobacter himalayensis]|uniref:sulfatase-like hydrolase/transferase n=1 Tax=Helicobacter himalayensis TaxID=1591088 RepID=UPI0008334A00|nr:sulfatase-like hydrolase/transferase [Helicobacter himalayensis]